MLIFKAQSEDSREWFVERVGKAGNGIRQTPLRLAQRHSVYLIADERVARACRERGWG